MIPTFQLGQFGRAFAAQRERIPTEMFFSEVATKDMEALMPGSVLPSGLVYLDEPFTSNTGQFTHITEGTQATFTVSGGTASINNTTSTDRNSIIKTGADLTMPQAWVEITMTAHPDTATGYDNIGVGVCKDANNFIFASYDRTGPRLRVQVKNAGTNTFLLSFTSTDYNFSYPWKLALSIVGNNVCVFYDKVDGNGWIKYDGLDITSYLNFKAASLTGWKAAFTAATANSSEWVFDNLKAGRFGAVGMRDVTLVTNEDGSPFDIDSGSVYFTATCAGPRGESNAGVFRLQLSDYALTQTAVLMVSRGGKTEPDVACHIVVRANGDRTLLMSTWANGFGGQLDILLKTTGTDLLNGSHVVDTMTTLTLPGDLGGTYGVYDPYLVKRGATWLLAYSVVEDTDFNPENFYIAAATSGDLSSWSSVDEDNSRYIFEGSKICIANGRAWIIGGGRTSAICYDESMAYQGTVNFVLTSPSGNTQPHLSIFPHQNKFICLSHTDHRYLTVGFSWGKLSIQESARYV